MVDIQAAIRQKRKVEIAIVNKCTLRDVEYFNSLHDIRRQAIARHEVINVSKTDEKEPKSKYRYSCDVALFSGAQMDVLRMTQKPVGS